MLDVRNFFGSRDTQNLPRCSAGVDPGVSTMPTRQLTTKFVHSLRPETKRVTINDARQSGLQLIIYPSGKKSYVLYKRVGGQPQRIYLANASEITPRDARRLAKSMLHDIAMGVDPLARRRQERSERTVDDLWSEWLEYAMAMKKSWRDDERNWNRLLQPVFGGKRLSCVSRADVGRWHARVGTDCGPYMANRSLALLRAMFNRAIRKLEWTDSNPAIGIDRFRETARERFLQPDELVRFFAALDQEDQLVQDLLRVMLFTGARRTNCLEMLFSEVQGNLWRPTRTKSGHPVAIPLVIEAMQIIERRRLAIEGDAVFPGLKPGVPFMSMPRDAWNRILEEASLTDLRIHDLRRTLGSLLACQGVNLPIIGQMLGHRPGSSATHVYARLRLDVVRESAESAVAAMLAYQQ